jgi:hypothetical protein
LVLARFYRSEDEFERLHQNLKLTLCPNCKATGTLILHGELLGYSENDDCRKSCRGKRVFCNNRKVRKNGCGHTFSVWAAGTLKRLRLSASTFWTFVNLVIFLGNKAQAMRKAKLDLSISSAYRLWKRFSNCQSHVRTILSKCCPAPELPHTRQQVEQTIAHLEAAFPGAPCPISAFQYQLQTTFLI